MNGRSLLAVALALTAALAWLARSGPESAPALRAEDTPTDAAALLPASELESEGRSTPREPGEARARRTVEAPPVDPQVRRLLLALREESPRSTLRIGVFTPDEKPIAAPRFLARMPEANAKKKRYTFEESDPVEWESARGAIELDARADPEEEGWWILDEVPARSKLSLAVDAPKRTRSLRGIVTPDPGETESLLRFYLIPSRERVVTLVVPPGESLHDAWVELEVEPETALSLSAPGTQRNFYAVPDANGIARFAHAPEGFAQVQCGATDVVSSSWPRRIPSGEGHLAVDLVFGEWVNGVLSDADGRPLPDTTVSFHHANRYGDRHPNPFARWQQVAPSSFSTTTDAAGRFRLRGAVAGEDSFLTAHLSGGVAVCSDWIEDFENITFRLPPLVRIRGRVFEEGDRPARSVVVQVHSSWEAEQRWDLQLRNTALSPDAAGAFTVVLPPGKHAVSIVRGRDLLTVLHETDVQADLDLGRIELPTGRLEVHLRGLERSFDGAYVHLHDAESPRAAPIVRASDGEERMTFDFVPDGRYVLHASTSGTWAEKRGVTVAGGRKERVTVALQQKVEVEFEWDRMPKTAQQRTFRIVNREFGCLAGVEGMSARKLSASTWLAPGDYDLELSDPAAGERDASVLALTVGTESPQSFFVRWP